MVIWKGPVSHMASASILYAVTSGLRNCLELGVDVCIGYRAATSSNTRNFCRDQARRSEKQERPSTFRSILSMIKRDAERDVSPYSKRQKLSKNGPKSKDTQKVTDIRSWRDLQHVLAFNQDLGPQLRQNVQHFKAFLDNILYSDDTESQASGRKILLEYLGAGSAGRDEGIPSHLSDLIQSWSFAAQTNNENLFSAIVAVIALFLKTISSGVEFRDYGNQICRTLLDDDQLKLLDRGLSASRVKGHVLSPCLRLLTEIVSYDGGTAARLVWRRKEITFKRLEEFFGMRKEQLQNHEDANRKPSIRDHSLRYLFANLRLQAPAVKTALLSLAPGKLARSIFQDLEQDSPSILTELLSIFRKEVLSSDEIPKHTKNALFREGTLSRIAFLYRYAEPDEPSQPESAVKQAAHSFLLFACTSPKASILERPIDGCQHLIIESDTQSQVHEGALTGSSLAFGRERPTPNKNRSVALFLQGLRPWASLLEKDLILATFQAAPDLLEDYFEKKQSFTLEPKLSATWIGYLMFLNSIMRMPITDAFLEMYNGTQTSDAAFISGLMETILPSPLTQKSMTRCLNQHVELITFLLLQTLILAFEKLQRLLRKLQDLETTCNGSIRRPTSLHIIRVFLAQCPKLRHIIAGFRSCNKEKVLQRQAFARLLSLYYNIAPQLALQEKFDISIPLSGALMNLGSLVAIEDGLSRLELESLLEIAKRSPDMRWWYKSGTLWKKGNLCRLADFPDDTKLSPFTMLLNIHIRSPRTAQGDSIESLLHSVSEDSHIVAAAGKMPTSINILCDSLRECKSNGSFEEVCLFLDNCALQCFRKSVVYHEDRAELVVSKSSEPPGAMGRSIDLLVMAIADQWPFLVKAASPSTILSATKFFIVYLNASLGAGADHGLLTAIRNRVRQATEDEECRSLLDGALNAGYPLRRAVESPYLSGATIPKDEDILEDHTRDVETEPSIQSLPQPPPEEDENHKALTQWSRDTIPEVILEGTTGELMLCLSSKHVDIRKQALNSLRILKESLKVSNVPCCLPWMLTFIRYPTGVRHSKDIY